VGQCCETMLWNNVVGQCCETMLCVNVVEPCCRQFFGGEQTVKLNVISLQLTE